MSLLSQAPVFDDPLHARLYEILCMDSLWIDMLVERSGSDSVAVMNALAVMEIDGIVTTRGGMYRVI
jgi:predicted Rossmann fold nucleotide-binding protein DprA/Smf involved in DNA uptake